MIDCIKTDLFVTPLWEIETGFSQEFNEQLMKEINTLPKDARKNIWKLKTPAVNQLRQKILECLDSTVKGYFPPWYPYYPQLLNCWVNEQGQGMSVPLHDHTGIILACVYYVKTPPNCGDLLLVDPRGAANWDWKSDKNFYGAKSHRIKPVAGKMAIFPGYLVHMVEPNQSHENRISIAVDIHNGNLAELIDK
jgi:uncharacterized protein (TIGR02466 family)